MIGAGEGKLFPAIFMVDEKSDWGPRVYLERMSDRQLIEEVKRRGWSVEMPVITLPDTFKNTTRRVMDADDFIMYLEEQFDTKLRFTYRQAQLVTALLLKYPAVARMEYIIDYMYSGDPTGGPESAKAGVRVLITKTRHLFDPLDIKIENDHGIGWRLVLPDLSSEE